jgi:sugar lactone lactonase YvrE
MRRADSVPARVIARDVGEVLESPRWHPARRCISLVDIPTGQVFEIKPDTHVLVEHSPGITPLGAALPYGSGYLLVGADGIWEWSPNGQTTMWATIPTQPSIVSNDAVLHRGAVWVGRMDDHEEPGAGSLWRITPDTAQAVVAGLTLPNGLVPTSDGRGLLFAESAARRIYRVPTDQSHLGSVTLEPFLEVPDWIPDGLARDPSGHLWVARWGEGIVTRVATSSAPGVDVTVPTPQTTAAAFDPQGAMYITTGREDFDTIHRSSDRLAGSIFVVAAGDIEKLRTA